MKLLIDQAESSENRKVFPVLMTDAMIRSLKMAAHSQDRSVSNLMRFLASSYLANASSTSSDRASGSDSTQITFG